MEFAGGHKRGRPEAAFNGNGGAKKHKQEGESFGSGLGSKSKPCTKFFSTSGCPFGESCHFLHYVPGGFKAVSQMQNFTPNPSIPHHQPPPRSSADSPSPTVKNRICNKFNTAEGCKFGDKCHFAHGEWELGKPSVPSYDDPRAMNRAGGRYDHHPPPPSHHHQGPAAASFGANATAKISIDSKLTGAIIGKNGVNSKQVCRLTGAKLSIRDHESDPNLRNIELEGSFEQIQQAHAMVQELIGNARSSFGHSGKRQGGHQKGGHQPGSNFKTKLCDNFMKSTCTFGDRCHFAHGAHELNTSGV